jgi:hypothetical protein
MDPANNLSFKFRYVQGGQGRGLLTKKATASDTQLDLDGEQILFQDILDAVSRGNRLVLELAPSVLLSEKTLKMIQDSHYLVLEIHQATADELEKHIDRHSSTLAAERHRQELAAAGKEDLFRTVTCPICGATIDLSDFAQTPYMYCRFCESILDRNKQVVSNGERYRICGECGMYDRIREYTIFDFYFLLVVYAWRTNRRFVCDTCASRLGRNALLRNLIFLLGIPSAIYVLIKANSGRAPALQQLAKANGLALKGKYAEANAIYDKLLQRFPDHPGFLLNQGMGYLNGQDVPTGSAYLARSLKACSNYQPTLWVAQRLRQAALETNTPR